MNRDVEEELHSRIRELELWNGTIAIRSLPGGITNRNFLVEDRRGQFVIRFGRELPDLGVYRRNEEVCHREAHRLGVAPEIVLANGGLLISRFIPSRTLTPEGVRQPGFAEKLASVLRRLHEGWGELSGDMLWFSPLQACRTYTATSRRLGAELPEDIEDLLAGLRVIHGRLGPYLPTLCHNDMLPANVLDDGQRIWIVDWEYAGVGHPLFDLAGISVNCEFSNEQDREFLTAYRGVFQPRDEVSLKILKVASLLREALWSVVQTRASDLDFDFREYAVRHFERYRRALSDLA